MLRFSALLGALLLAATLLVTQTRAAAGIKMRSASFDTAGVEMDIDERGQLSGDLFDERGEMHRNPRVNLRRQQPGFNYGSTKVRGVNLGGWLVAEPWITPSLFDNTGDSRVIDEWTFGQYVSNAGSRLESHWSSFITESDFQQIAAAGLNHVRIPIGYWALDKGTSPFYKGSQYAYLKKAVGWAGKYGLKVMIDLHGAPGSQNGFDNSGRKVAQPNWFSQQSYKDRAKAVVQQFARDFAGQTNTVTAIELLNEPLTTTGISNALSFTRDYYNNAYYAVRYPSGNQVSNFAVAIHDGFQPLSYWKGAYPTPTYQQVILDTHIYSVFDFGQIALSNNARLQYFCNMRGAIGSSQTNLYTITGEWTNAPTDCAKYLNGRGIGARYDGTFPGSTRQGSCSGKTGATLSDSSYKAFLGQMFDTQRRVYETGSGWVFWTWKTEQAADWDYKRGLAGGWITRNLNSFNGAAC